MELIGKKINNYEVISFLEKIGDKKFYLCKCKCGKTFKKRRDGIISGRGTSCGCLQKEKARIKKRTHNMSFTPEYNAYQNMISRCTRTYATGKENYSLRGITVCDRWLNSFENFYKDMGQRPSDEYSLDRIDNNGNYCKENCRWATKKEQDNNKRTNRNIKYKNEIGSISYFAEKYNIKPATLLTRILRGKWPVEAAIEKPLSTGWKKPFVHEEIIK